MNAKRRLGAADLDLVGFELVDHRRLVRAAFTRAIIEIPVDITAGRFVDADMLVGIAWRGFTALLHPEAGGIDDAARIGRPIAGLAARNVRVDVVTGDLPGTSAR